MHNHLVVSHDGQLRVFGLMLLVVLLLANARLISAQNDNNSVSNNSNAAQGSGNNNSSSPNNNRKPDQPPAPSGTPAKPGDTTQTGTQDPSKDPMVTEVTGNLALFNSVTVTVKNLQELLKQAEVVTADDLKKIILHVDGYPLKGLPVRRVSISGKDSDKLAYNLMRTDDLVNVGSWNSLLGRPKIFPEPKTKKVRVSVGLENRPVDTAVTEYEMTVVNYRAYWLYVLGLIVISSGLIYLAWKSDLLRDPGPDPPREKDATGKWKPKKYKPFSLARTQMAMWFLVIIASYLFIWMVTSNAASLTPTVLGLMGISAGTGLGSALIDSNKRKELDNKKEDLDREAKTLEVQIDESASGIAATNDAGKLETLRASLTGKQTRLAQVKEELTKLNTADKPLVSEGIMTDILSDNNGVSFHRFQIFAWTLALIVIFIASVYNVLSMPDFDGTLLALMGISSGTYLGFKVPEDRTPPKEDTSAATTTTTTATPGQQATEETKK
jgi:hypothetical protein